MARISPQPAFSRNLPLVMLTASVGQAFLALNQSPWTLWIGLAFFAAAFWKASHLSDIPSAPEKPILWEKRLFLLILVLAGGALLWRLGSFPPGLHDDQGETGCSALRILREGWLPTTEVFLSHIPLGLEFYQLAGWFYLFGSGEWSFHFFFIYLSLATLLLFYWLTRRLAGPAMALLSLFFLAAMRWQWSETRGAQPSMETPFYLLGLLLLFHLGIRTKSRWVFPLSAAWAGLGFYGYPSLKALPMVWVGLAIYEWSREPACRPFFRKNGLAAALFLLFTAAPYLSFCWSHGTFGNRESETWVFSEVAREKSLRPLFESITGTLLAFNRKASDYPMHNIPGHRLLDDVTGALFLLGLAWSWRKRREPEAAYPFISFGVMLLPSLLTTDPGSPQRLTGCMPWVAYFAAWAAKGLWETAKRVWPRWSQARFLVAGGLLLGVAAQNGVTYFGVQAQDPRCQAAFGPEQSFIGRKIMESEKAFPGRYRYWVDPLYAHSPTVFFLAYPAKDRIEPFYPSEWMGGGEKGEALVFLNGDKPGTAGFLQSFFPSASTEALAGPDGYPRLYLFTLPANRKKHATWDNGLKGVYLSGAEGSKRLIRFDPVLDFSSRFDFPFTDSALLRAQWSGSLRTQRPGRYQFQVLSAGQARLWMDKKPVPFEKPVPVAPGEHSFRLDYEKGEGYFNALHLIWKKPGDAKWEAVPAENFGNIRSASSVSK